MKKIKKLIVALLAMTMVIGCLAVQASAADTKKMVVYLTNDSNVKTVLLDIHNYGGGKFLTPAGNVTTEESVASWGRNLYEFTVDKNDSTVWTMDVAGSVDLEGGDWTNMQIVVVTKDGTVGGFKYFMDNDGNIANAQTWNANDTLYYSIDVSKKGDYPNVSASTSDPRGISASECIDAINAIGTVELTANSKAKIDDARTKVNSYAGNASDITNMDKLTAAEAKWEELVAAAPGKLTLHVKHEWDAVAGYVWGSKEDAGSWPGTVGLANVSNTGWDDITITLSAANTLILNDNKKNDGEKTADITYMSQGEYWVTIAADKSYTITKTAPEGWVLTSDADAAANVETLIDSALALDATKANKGKYDEALSAYKALTDAQKKLVDAEKVTALNAGVKTIEDIIAKEQAEEDAKNAGTLTVYVKSPSWEAMSVYGWDGAEFGEWPGKKLTALKANEGWFSVSFDITKATNLIFNDGKASSGEQTVDWKEVKAGTYWLVLSEKDDKGKYLVDALSTKAPEGWKEEAAEKIEQELPSNISTVTQEEINAMKDSIKVEGTTDKLVVSPLEAVSKDVAVITTALSKELKGVKFVAVDLKFESGKQPTAGTKITIDVTKMADVKAAKYVAVYSVKDAKMELVDTVEVKDGKITFAPKHFSTYVFAEAADPTANPDGGVVNTAVIVSAVVMLAAATVIVASKKRVTE